MAIGDTFRVPGGARGLTQGGSLTFIQFRPLEPRPFRRQQLVVVEGVPQRIWVSLPDHYEVLDGGELVAYPCQQGNQRGVDDDRLLSLIHISEPTRLGMI